MSHTPFNFKVDANLPYDKLFQSIVTFKTKGEKIQSYFWIWFEFAAIAMQHRCFFVKTHMKQTHVTTMPPSLVKLCRCFMNLG